MPTSEVCSHDEPSYLHKNVYTSTSYGHVVRDNLSIVAANLLKLGLQQRDYQLVVDSDTYEMYRHYHSYVASSMVTWAELQTSCSQRYESRPLSNE